MQLGYGALARVRLVTDDGSRVYLDLRNGSTATIDNYTGPDVAPGDVLLLGGESDDPELSLVDSAVWPDEPWVGVVKLKLPDITVVDSSGRLRTVPTTTAVDYREGNTVEASEFRGVSRVLTEDPIRYLDIPSIDEITISHFRAPPPGADGLTFEDFGGLKGVAQRARELIEVPLKYHSALARIGARPIKGVLFTGPPGTGKTLLAQIIAAQASAEFYKISGPEIFSKWYGQSEELIRRLFEAAASHDRAIVFFDEIDSVASGRDEGSHEVSRRVVAQLLTAMDGFTRDSNVVVIATTNRPQDLDPALRRPGRFDWEIEFPLPSRDDRVEILRQSARRLRTQVSLPHHAIAEATDGWSAAELAAIWSEAALLAVADGRDRIVAEDYIGGHRRVSDQRDRVGSKKWSAAR
ncbi:MAG TPA: ATP-binding protein [Propionicimonas sp.]|jgi:transitional endoplasmic reticulum ATPase